MYQSTDKDIREAFHRKKLKVHHQCRNTLVIDELGVAHGKKRIDIAVLNGCLHGYEIKSAKDTLLRLPEQIETYAKTFQKISLVVAPNHLDKVLKVVPEWCGVMVATKGSRGGIGFSTISRAKSNPHVDLYILAHLLWRDEVKDYLLELGVENKFLNKPRKELYKTLEQKIFVSDLINKLKFYFKSRENWRDLPQQLSYDGLR